MLAQRRRRWANSLTMGQRVVLAWLADAVATPNTLTFANIDV